MASENRARQFGQPLWRCDFGDRVSSRETDAETRVESRSPDKGLRETLLGDVPPNGRADQTGRSAVLFAGDINDNGSPASVGATAAAGGKSSPAEKAGADFERRF